MTRIRQSAGGAPHQPGRRNFLFGSAVVGAGSVLAACTNQQEEPAAAQQQQSGGGNQQGSLAPGDQVTLGVSVPGADHGWLAAVTTFAQQAGESFEDVELNLVEGSGTSAAQVGQIETLISQKPDAMVILPQEGQALTAVSQQAMEAGIPVVNLDRIFSSPLAYRTWIGGDNYGMGVSAAHYIGSQLPDGGRVVEIQGLASLELTQQRSQGFADALKSYPNIEVVARQAADFTPDTGREVMSNVLQAQQQIDAVWNHDDDQGVGVEAAVRASGREDEFFMVGGAGSKAVMESIRDGGIWKATVLYSPSMAADAVFLARLVAQNRGLDGFAQPAIPQSITLFAAVVTQDNVDQYMEVGF